MKILLATPFFPPDRGGVPVHASSLVREFRARGHEVVVFRRVGNEGREYAIELSDADGVPVYAVRYRWRDLRTFERAYRIPEVEARFEEVIRREAPDVVHALHLTGMGVGLPGVARSLGVPFFLTLADFWMGCPRSQRMTREFDLCPTIDRRKCLPCLRPIFGGMLPEGEEGLATLAGYDAAVRDSLLSATRLLAPSRHARDLYAADGIPAERLEVVPFGVDPAPFRVVKRVPSDRFRIAFLGSVMLAKGVHVLLDALAHLPRERLRVAVHGEPAPWHEVKDYADSLRARLRPDDPVAFTGPYDPADVPRLLSDADCLVVPSVWYETYSITIREGWLAGLPVVASRLGAMEEAIEDGRTGLLFRTGDARDLAEKLRMLLDDPGLRARLASSPKVIPTAAEVAGRLLGIYAAVTG